MKNKITNSCNDSIKVNLLYLLKKSGKTGVSREAIEELYFAEKNEQPNYKSISRIVNQLDLYLCRQAVRVEKKQINGRTKYFLEKDCA